MPESLTQLASTGDHPSRPDDTVFRRRWAILGVLCLSVFLAVVDNTIVNVALPRMSGQLHASNSQLQWIVDAYSLAFAGLLLIGGSLGDRFGRKGALSLGIIAFAGFSVFAGLSGSVHTLITARALMGAAAAFVFPATLAILTNTFRDPKERATAIGIWTGVVGLAVALGPLTGGALLQHFWWGSIFFVNLPVAVLAMIAVSKLVDESRADVSTQRGRPDVAGAVLVTAGLSGVVYGLIQAANHAWGSADVLLPLLAGIALLVGFVAVESRIAEPLVPLRFFQNRTRVTANLVTVLFSAVFFTMFFLLTLYWENVLGYSALKAGLAYLPFGVGIGIGIGVSTALVPKVGVKPLLGAGFAMFAVGMALLTRITVEGSYLGEVLPGLVLMAFGSGLCFAGFGNASVHEVSVEDASLASGVQNAGQQVGGAVGLAVLATVALRHSATVAREQGLDRLHATVVGTTLAFTIGAVIMAVGAVVIAVVLEKVKAAPPELVAAH